jgi:hypothetical protein
MGKVNYYDFFSYLDSYNYQFEYFDHLYSLLVLQRLYLACSSILFIIQVIKITLNLFNYGDFNLSLKKAHKTINSIISLVESFFFVGFAIVLGYSSYYGEIFYIQSNFLAAMVCFSVYKLLTSLKFFN